jgi:hypothetical protein
VIGMFNGGQGGFAPAEIAAVEKQVKDRGAIPIY